VIGNVKKIRSVYDKNTLRCPYLANLIDLEFKEGDKKHELPATSGLLWLSRGLHFLYECLNLLLEDFNNNITTESMSTIVKKAYDESLAPHHNSIMQSTFHLVAHATPKRQSLYNNVTKDTGVSIEQTMLDMGVFLRNVKSNLVQINKILIEYKIQ